MRRAYWFFGDPAQLRAFDALSARAGNVLKIVHPDLRAMAEEGHPDADWAVFMAWPEQLVDFLVEEGASHLHESRPFGPQGLGWSVRWFFDDLFSLSAGAIKTNIRMPVECSQKEVAEFLEMTNRGGLLGDLAARGEITYHESEGGKFWVRFVAEAKHWEFAAKVAEWRRK